jgi:hypothetical protein
MRAGWHLMKGWGLGMGREQAQGGTYEMLDKLVMGLLACMAEASKKVRSPPPPPHHRHRRRPLQRCEIHAADRSDAKERQLCSRRPGVLAAAGLRPCGLTGSEPIPSVLRDRHARVTARKTQGRT